MKTLLKKPAMPPLKQEWNHALDFWNGPRVENPVFYFDKSKIDAGMRDVIAWMNVVERRAYFNMQRLDERLGRNNFRPTGEHEIGHDTFCPYDLRMCLLLTHEANEVVKNRRVAGDLENFFADTMVNTRIVHKGDKSIVNVYRKMSQGLEESKFWNVYMRTCEKLWSLPAGTLAKNVNEEMQCDAKRLDDIIRKAIYPDDVYKDWPKAMRDFAEIMKKHLPEPPQEKDPDQQQSNNQSNGAGGGNGQPQQGPNQNDKNKKKENSTPGGVIDYHTPKDFAPVRPKKGDKQVEAELEKAVRGVARRMSPEKYKSLISNSGLASSKKAITWFYRDLANQFDVMLPYAKTESGGSTPVGIGVWNLNDSFKDLDIILSLEYGPFMPGETTRKKIRGYIGEVSGRGGHPDMMLCIDCSGSMPDPGAYLSISTLSAMVVAHAAVRAERKCAVVLFSDRYDVLGYTKDKDAIDEQITNYINGGTLIPAKEINQVAQSNPNPQHIVIISDTEIFNLDKTNLGQLESALKKAGAGGTVFLNNNSPGLSQQLKNIGYNVINMNRVEDLLGLSLELSNELYGGG
jgi:hypothetical protein